MSLPYKILVVVLALLVSHVSAYRFGVKVERGRHASTALTQERADRKQEQNHTVASEQVADSTREAANEAASQTAGNTQSAVERIRYVYKTVPAACPAARPVPDSVRRELDEANAALAASR